MGCPGGGKEATRYLLSTDNRNYQASEEERSNKLRSNPAGLTAEYPVNEVKINFPTLREAYGGAHDVGLYAP